MENIVKEAIYKLNSLTPVVKNCYELGNEQRILLADKSWAIGLKNAQTAPIFAVLQNLHPFKEHIIDAPQMDISMLTTAINNAQKFRFQTKEDSVIIAPSELISSLSKLPQTLLLAEDFCQDILDNLVKEKPISSSTSTADSILNRWVMKHYRQIWIYGDTLVSGLYAAYAAAEIKKNYGKYPLILLFHDNDVRTLLNVDINSELLKKLGIPVFSKITEVDIYDIPEHSLFITPQHRLFYTQTIIAGSDTDIYTIPEQDVIIKDDNLAMYYVDKAMQELSKDKGHASCLRLWHQAKLKHNFESKLHEEILRELSETVERLVKEHKPRLQELYRQI